MCVVGACNNVKSTSLCHCDPRHVWSGPPIPPARGWGGVATLIHHTTVVLGEWFNFDIDTQDTQFLEKTLIQDSTKFLVYTFMLETRTFICLCVVYHTVRTPPPESFRQLIAAKLVFLTTNTVKNLLSLSGFRKKVLLPWHMTKTVMIMQGTEKVWSFIWEWVEMMSH